MGAMLEWKENTKAFCNVCGEWKTVGKFITDRNGGDLWICTQCLDNASRLISKKEDRIFWDRQEMKLKNIYREDIKRWEELYPALDVMYFLEKKIPEWIIKNTLIGKSVKSDYRRFIMNWLNREQQKAIGL